MKTCKNVIWGIVLVALGVLIGLKQFDILNFNIFFDGWWTLFIIIPSFIGLFDKNEIKGSVIGLIIGITLLLACQDVISFATFYKLLLPTIFVIIGLSLLFQDVFNKNLNKKINEMNKTLNKDESIFCIFAGQEVNIDKKFEGTTINAIFGGVDLDLNDAEIKDDVVINCTAIFGGIDINLPKDVRVEIKSSSLFGGVSDERKEKEVSDKSKTVYINSLCLFGGVELKCKSTKK